MESVTRRQFIKTAGGVTLATVAMTGIAGGIIACTTKAETLTSKPPVTPAATSSSPEPTSLALPWPYKKIDPTAAAERAYTAYYNGGCMYGAFEGIVGELQKNVGTPYTTFPSTMMKYGGGGVNGWGTLCGTLNGAAAAIYLVIEAAKAGPIINEIYGWYTTSALPDYTPATPKFTNIKTSVANSPLCHVSVSKWCVASGLKSASAERADRCAWLTASTAKKIAEVLNAQADATFKATFAVPASVTGCLSCHGKGGAVENVHMSNQTSCTECHTDLGSAHPAVPK